MNAQSIYIERILKTRFHMKKTHQAPGFALIATIMLMVLLAILTIGTLSLSVVTLRSTSQDAAQSQARANARMALMLAIGELQKQMGPDQRISANADILSIDESGTPTTVLNPKWTGVWDSWIAGDIADAPVGENYPSAPSHHQTLGDQPSVTMRPSYANKSRHFRAWLLSLNPEEATNIFMPMSETLQGESMPQIDDDAVLLVGEGSLGSSSVATDFVSARLIPIKETTSSDTRGRYAWWVGDESQKAGVMNDSYYDETLSYAEKMFRSQAPASTGTTTLAGLSEITPQQETKLEGLPSLKTLDVVPGVQEVTVNGNTFRASQKNFHHTTAFSYQVLADVREGGLKRDLSTILERTIDPNDVYNFTYVQEFQRPTSLKLSEPGIPGGEDFMLYNFDSMLESFSPTGMANVPIQDLAAYYQLYDQNRPATADETWDIGGIQYSSNESSPPNNSLAEGIMVSTPDFGNTQADYDKYLRQYTAQYRRLAPVKQELVLHYVTEERTAAEIAADPLTNDGDPSTIADTHKLRIGVTPSMTFWNPYNVSLVMNKWNSFTSGTGAFTSKQHDKSSYTWIENAMPLNMRFKKGTSADDPTPVTVDKKMSDVYDSGFQPYFYTNGNYQMIFKPGETKVLSLQATSLEGGGGTEVDFMNRGGGGRRDNEHFVAELELVPGWDPNRFVVSSDHRSGSLNTRTISPLLTFKASDYISVDITAVSGAFSFTSISTARQHRVRSGQPQQYHHKLFNWLPRLSAPAAFTSDFMHMGFPRVGRGGIASTAPRPIKIPARRGQILIDAMGADISNYLPQTFFYYGRKATTETHESRNMSPPLGGGGRRFPARPFLHSSLAQSTFFDSLDGSALYNYGWNWFFMPLDNSLDIPISISSDDSGYFGGGYTAEKGTTHVVQQHLPLTPPISIAALSNAYLGGYSIATEAPMEYWNLNPATVEAWRRVTATGFAGLAPTGLQAIGNSYAHPNIPAGKAVTIWKRMFVEGTNTNTPFADHSYLANKALWDEYFFTSISPVPADNPIFDSSPKTVDDVATGFFFDGESLPNRRMIPYTKNIDETKLSSLLDQYPDYLDGFADKIAAHLMVKGAFNINSTSVEAWKALFSSLKGKPVAYFDKDTSLTAGVTLNEDIPDGVPVASGTLPNAESYTGSSSSPSDPEQWLGWRELTVDEIEELAKAMVNQVKIRGPFLSLSEFVNRRLDSRYLNLSVKGALQAAIDDPAIPSEKAINGGFRSADRIFSTAEKSFVGAVFPEAMEGAIAYGSSAYVDQADILRSMAAQITPRGDTFVIRTYGDALDTNGKIVARAWCEAIVQRVPDYVNSEDENHVKQSDLISDDNKQFGRKFDIVSFRWLNPSEI